MNEENKIVQDFSSLRVGDNAVIAGFTGAQPAYRKKLLAMGMTPGTPLKVIRMAPLGDPVEVMVRGYLVSLRRQEASIILVTAVNQS